jgi:drug/metabolite transporter (DMT)-like permease
MSRRRLVGIALGVIAGASWGTGPLFFKGYVLPAGVGWITMLFWRFAFATLISWAWLLVQPRARAALRELDPRTFVRLMVTGAVFICSASAYYSSIERIDISLAALLMSIYPVVVAVASMRLGYRLQGGLAWASVVVVMIGTALTIGGVGPGTDQLGILLAVAGPLFYSGYIVLQSWMAGERPGITADMRSNGRGADVPPPVAGAVMMTGTFAASVVIGVVGGVDFSPIAVPGAAWPGILGIAFFTAAIAIQAFYASAARIGAAQASLMATVEPVVVIVLGVTLLGETLSPIRMLGAAVVIGGVVLAQAATPPETRPVVLEEP